MARWNRGHRSFQGNSGAALIVTLMVLLGITVLGVALLRSASVEHHIVRNEREARLGFYLAEAAAGEGVQRLRNLAADEASTVDLLENFLFWHHSREAAAADVRGLREPEKWNGADDGWTPDCLPGEIDPATCIVAVTWRVAPGGSLVITDGTRLYENRVYGMATKEGVRHLVEIGYYLRY